MLPSHLILTTHHWSPVSTELVESAIWILLTSVISAYLDYTSFFPTCYSSKLVANPKLRMWDWAPSFHMLHVVQAVTLSPILGHFFPTMGNSWVIFPIPEELRIHMMKDLPARASNSRAAYCCVLLKHICMLSSSQ